MRHLIKIVFLTICALSAFGQDNTVLHMDKPYYVPGEIMWYKLYLPTEFGSSEITFKAIIANKDGNKIDSYFVNNDGDQLSGYYRIPFTWDSDIYSISFAALDESSLAQKVFAQFSFSVYNDLDTENGLEISTETMDKMEVSSDNDQVAITMDKSVYMPGENVQIGIKSSNRIVEYSISVIDQDLLGSGKSVISNNIDVASLQGASFTTTPYIQGRVSTKEGEGKKINQLGVYDGAQNNMHLARSNNEGQFTLVLPESYGNRSYQFAGYVSNEASELDVEMHPDNTPSIAENLVVTDKIVQYLEASKLRKKIYQYYETLEYDLAPFQSKVKKNEIKAEKSYNMSEYVQFNTLGQFFDEIISAPLQFQVSEGKAKAVMYDSEGFNRYNSLGAQENFPIDPLFIVNGKLTKDATYIYSLPLEEVKSVELYTSRKSLAQLVGNFRNYGVAIINSVNPGLTVPISDEQGIRDINTLLPEASFSSLRNLEKDMPQLRPLVYWNENISDGSGLTKPLIFKSTDDISTFLITVVGRTESGDIVKGSTTYTTSLDKG